MDVNTQQLGKVGAIAAQMKNRIDALEAENARLKAENAYYKKALSMLAIDPDGEIDPDIVNVAYGEVLDAND